jgi:ferredoxin
MDPLCMTRCPVGSIRRKETLDIVIEDWCIGCSNCASDCPYGNINVTLVPDLGGGKKQKAEPRPKAVVCDLCVDYGEPNCVRACPHDAAIRVEPKTFFASELVGPTLAVAPAIPQTAARPGNAPPGELTGVQPEGLETQIYSNIADLLSLMPRLRVVSGTRAGAVLQLRYPSTSFGRSAEADYRFQDDEKMSRLHCVVVCENSRFLVRDLNSTNGTLVNGNPVTELELRNNDVIEIGGQQIEFLAGQSI